MPHGKHRTAWHWIQAYADHWTSKQRVQGQGPDASWFRLRLSTDGADGDPYDFWRNRVYYDFSADRRLEPGVPFSARAELVAAPRGEFVHASSSDLSGARTRASLSTQANANLTIGLVLAGRRDYETGDWRHRAEAGDLYLYDASLPSRLAMTDHRVVYLSLKADEVDAVLGQDRPDQAILLQRLQEAPLRLFLQMQLMLMIESEQRPAAWDSGRLLEIAIDIALLMLQQAPDLPDMDPGDLRRGLVVAAQHLISQQIDNPHLDPDLVAARLGVSRATLYRAFAGQGMTLAGQIRMMRLIRARHLIEHSASAETIGELILHCGIDDTVHFARQFRQFFGVRPGEIKGIRFGDVGG